MKWHRFLACVACVMGALVTVPSVTLAATTIEREFTFDASRVSIDQQSGWTTVRAAGGMREFAAGHPDLPWISERIDLPPGTRATSIEVLSLETAPLASNARLRSAVVAKPGITDDEYSVPNAALFQSAAFQPEVPVRLGGQGDLRGRHVAYLGVSPARWSPLTGRLERVTRVRVRVTLESNAEPALVRERIVREWEDELPTGTPSRELGAALTSLAGDSRQATPFKATQLPSLLGSPVAYVIITNDVMAPVFQQLADWKTQCGLPTVVRTVSFIQQQYPFGADDAERIRLFIRDAYARWGTKYVLLGGDSEVIPVRLAYTTFYGGEKIATDMYYSCLDGNWNADGDSLFGEGFYSSDDPGDACDLMPEVYVGRSPTITAADAQLFVNKTLQYEKTPVGDYEQSILLMGEVLFPQNWIPGQGTSLDGAELIEEILPYFQGNACSHFTRLYENYTDSRWLPGALQESRQRVIDSLNVGYNLAVHVGHGYRNVMSVGDDNLSSGDAQNLHNGNRLMNLYAINCTSNAIDFPCIGESFLRAANGGAVTNVGSTRFDFPTAGRAYQDEYFRLIYQDSVTSVGDLLARQKLPFIPFSSYDGVNRWTQMTLLMLGDPELRLWTCQPSLLTVTVPPSVSLSDSQVTVHVVKGGSPLYGARVTAYRAGDDFRTGTTNGSGDVTLPFRPDSIGSITVTVTAFNCRPFQSLVPIVASASPVLAEGVPVIDDDNAGGTVGNSNGQVDAGETIDVRVPLRNNGGAGATGVNAGLTTTDGLVTIVDNSVAYGSIGVGAVVNPASGFRISLPYTLEDQREIPFVLTVTADGGRSFVERFSLTSRGPDVRHFSHTVVDAPGNGNGIPEAGETVNYTVRLRNLGTGLAETVSARLRSYDGLSTVPDSSATFGNIATATEVAGDPVTFVPSTTAAKLALVVSDKYGVLYTQTLDLSFPNAPTTLLGVGAATTIALTWAHNTTADLLGYNIYRSLTSNGTFTKVNANPTERTSYFLDGGLAPLTRYYYKVTAVDSSGNESAFSAVASASTNPPSHTIFPIPMGRNTPSSVALEYIYGGGQMDIVAGSDLLYVIHADGTTPVDADGAGTTVGDFSTRGSYFAAAPSVGELSGTGDGFDIVAPSWDSTRVYVFDKLGAVEPGWPLVTSDAVWSSAALGDFDGNGSLEMAFGSNGSRFYAMRANGSEWLDGDSNPATKGVFKVLGSSSNFGTPALADIDGNSQLDIVYGGFDGKVYVWHTNGTNATGWPVQLNSAITTSIAVGYLDGAGDPTPELVVATANESLYVFNSNGLRRPGWPLWIKTSGGSKVPSPALADMNNDGFLDIVFQSTGGGMFCFNRNGTVLPGLSNLRYSALTAGASESSPVVADINGDGFNDIICGDEAGLLSAFSGANGALLPGFPIQLEGEVRGAPAVADIDGDGKTEIVLSGWDKNIYVWDYDFPFSPSGPAPWPQFHHDARRTGFFNAPLFVGVDDDPAAGGTVGAAIDFAPPAPNPASSKTRLWFGVPAGEGGKDYEVAVYDLTGRRIQVVDHGIARAGRFSAEWNLRGTNGAPADNGIYFVRFTLGGRSVSRKLVVMH